MCFLILRAKLIIIETLPCYCLSFYTISNTTIDMGGRLTLNFPFIVRKIRACFRKKSYILYKKHVHVFLLRIYRIFVRF